MLPVPEPSSDDTGRLEAAGTQGAVPGMRGSGDPLLPVALGSCGAMLAQTSSTSGWFSLARNVLTGSEPAG